MGTPFITLLEPTRLDGYDNSKPSSQQAPHISKTFRDAMEVREAVFVAEQGWSLALEHDADDARSCHWVTYASVNRTTEPEERDPRTGEVTRPRKSETRGMPIGTLRIVPFPHPPHPHPGGRYIDNVLQEEEDPPPSSFKKQGDGAATRPRTRTLTSVDEERQVSALPFGADAPTTYHDGKEPYVKLGRLAVIPMFRGHHIAGQLWHAAKKWLEDHPAFFNPSVTELGMDQLKAGGAGDIPHWNGLICCHAQEGVVKLYEKWGFKVDEGMGRWHEEGVPHVGMFQRLQIKKVNPKV
ncbi:hypothetical protein F4804DRAFT_198710 [Jackrogersella minutella]|nr:hypothetical protein F4804DRAFT_198710 [Jackrogersella minutella]